MRRFALVAAVVLSAVCVPVHAHDEIPGLRNVIDRIEPGLPAGVRIEVVASAADQLVASNDTMTELVVLGTGGEPFLRIGAGAVHANLRSPDWYRTASPDDTVAVPAGAAVDAEPNWVRVRDEPSWGWFDHRLHRAALDAPPLGARGTVRLESWTVPMRYGDQPLVVRGHREFARPQGFLRSVVTAAPARVQAVALDGAVPALSLTALDGASVTVEGADGRPFLRVTPEGVEADVASPSWRLTAASNGAPPLAGTPSARWEHQGDGSTVTWLEERLRPPAAEPPAAVVDRGRPAVLLRWSIPVAVDGRSGEIAGTTSWVPLGQVAPADADRSTGSRASLLAAAATVALAVGYLLIRRRRARARVRAGRRG